MAKALNMLFSMIQQGFSHSTVLFKKRAPLLLEEDTNIGFDLLYRHQHLYIRSDAPRSRRKIEFIKLDRSKHQNLYRFYFKARGFHLGEKLSELKKLEAQVATDRIKEIIRSNNILWEAD